MAAIFNHILSVILWTPLTGALVILLTGEGRTTLIRRIALGFATAAFLASVPLWFWYQPHGKTWQFAERGPGIASIGMSYYIGVDGFSILLILLTTLVVVIAIAASRGEITERGMTFYMCLLALEGGLLGVFMALDFLLFFVCSQIALLTVGFLIRTWDSQGRRQSNRFFVHTAVGCVFMLAGILALYFYNHASTGRYSFDITHYHAMAIPSTLQWWVFIAFLVAFASSVPLVPLHTWLPAAQAGAPTAVSIVLSAVVLKIGMYGFIRFSLPMLPDASRSFVPVMAVVAILGIVYGGVRALTQRDWMPLITYSVVSQMGIAVLGLFALTPGAVTGSIVLLIGQGVSVAALLLMARFACERGSDTGISMAAPVWKATPVFASMFLIVVLTAVGVLTLNGWFATSLVVEGTAVAGRWWAAAGVAGTVLGAVCLLWFCQRTVFGPAMRVLARSSDLSIREIGMLVPLIAAGVWIALHPAPVLRRIETSVGRVVARVNPAYRSVVAQGSDCATPAAPEPAAPPPEFLLVESCADGSTAAQKPADPAGRR